MAVRFILFDRWNEMIGEIPMLDISHYQKINGEDTLEFDTTIVLSQGDRVLWNDLGVYREHVVNGSTQTHFGGEEFSYVCESSLIWDWGHKQIRYAAWEGATASYVLTQLVKLVPGWSVGTVDDLGTASFEFQRCTAYNALTEAASSFGAEFESVITVDKTGVTKRTVNLVKKIGKDSGARFDYEYGIDGVEKEIQEDYFFTACYGYGKSNGTGPDSMTWVYVVDNEAAKVWGMSDGHGGISHTEGIYENPECEDVNQLNKETVEYLNEHSKPPITYHVDIPEASLMGVRLGDTLDVVDREFTPELRIQPRMAEMERDLKSMLVTSCTFGTVVSVVPDAFARAYDASKSAKVAAERAESQASAITAQSIMIDMNKLYEQGGTNVVLTPSGGIITASVPLDSEGNPLKVVDGITATRFSNGHIYYSNSVENGKWVWVEATFTEPEE